MKNNEEETLLINIKDNLFIKKHNQDEEQGCGRVGMHSFYCGEAEVNSQMKQFNYHRWVGVGVDQKSEEGEG